MKRIILISLACILIIGGVLAIYPLNVFKTRANGVKLVPTKVISPAEVTYFLQNDPLWTSDSLGNSSSSMGGSGCLISSIAATISHLGFPYTPAELNEIFTENGVYTENGLVIWKNIKNAIPHVDYKYGRTFNVDTIERLLTDGKLPIIEVKYKGFGINHWVVVIGADENDFLIMDPLNQAKTPIKLSEHGGRAYAYRVMINTN